MKPRLLDLFCGAGGAAMGYHRAGFEVVGVDIKPQPRYPFVFIEQDALFFLERLIGGNSSLYVGNFDAIHASPPCQLFSAYQRANKRQGDHLNLIPQTRELLEATGLPYVIENVAGSPLHGCVVMVCGTQFDPPMDIQRHRFFETNWLAEPTMWPCRHKLNGEGRWPASTNRRRGSRRTIAIGQWNTPLEVQQQAMGIDWMTLEELSEAIPPAYTEFIGTQLMAHLKVPVA